MVETPEILDVRGLNCPLPVLKAKKALASVAEGCCLQVETTDPLAAIDIPAFCRESGHELVSTEDLGSYQVYLIRKR